MVTQKSGITDLKLSEPLTGCPKAKTSAVDALAAALAKKKPKTRQLWGSGKGAFRTTGQYSAATVRGTTWNVRDTCTTTVTKVSTGVVSVNDFTLKKTFLIKAHKSHTALAKKPKKK